MSAPFQPGDVVVCVDASPCGCERCLLGREDATLYVKRGHHYRVEVCFVGRAVPFVAVLAGVPARPGHQRGTNAARFRKIDDEQYPEVLERLKSLGRSKPRLNPSRHDAYKKEGV